MGAVRPDRVHEYELGRKRRYHWNNVRRYRDEMARLQARHDKSYALWCKYDDELYNIERQRKEVQP